MKSVEVKLKGSPDGSYAVEIGSGTLSAAGKWARRCLGKEVGRVCIVSDANVYSLFGEIVTRSLSDAGFSTSSFLIGDGETHKGLKTVEACLTALSDDGIGRSDAIVALGGGVVGDVAGFAAAIHMRGIRFVQVPTTVVAMVDSSVGGKTGVNSSRGKNMIGAFHRPSGVLADVETLRTLPAREFTSGLYEMVKHALLRGRADTTAIDRFLALSPAERLEAGSEFAQLAAVNLQFKASIVGRDERESTRRRDGKSRKILNLGHTLAHALEKITDYRKLRHGEAVGYGLLFAAELSKSLALLDEKSVKLLNGVVHRVGELPAIDNIDIKEVLEVFRFDKKQVSGSVDLVLLKDIGRPVLVSSDQIPVTAIKKALRNVLR